MKIISQYKGLPRQVYLLLIARTINASGLFVHAFLTLFLSTRLGFDEAAVGRYLFIVSLCYLPAALVGGKLADRFNRKYVYICSMLLADVFLIVCGFICDRLSVVYLIICALFFVNMGMPILATMMMDLTNPKNRQESFSLSYLGANLGWALGSVIAGVLFVNYTQWIFWGQALMNLLALSLIVFGVKNTTPDESEIAKIAEDKERVRETYSKRSLLSVLFDTPIVLIFALLASVYAFSYAQLSFITPLQMEDIFGLDNGSKFYGVAWSLNGVCVCIGTPILVYLSKRFGPLFNMALTGLLYAVGLGLYAQAQSLWVFYLLVVIWSAGEIIGATNTGVFIANNAPVSHRARFQSIYEVVQGIGRALGPVVMGTVLMERGMAASWLLIAALCFAAGTCFILLHRCYLKRGSGSGVTPLKQR